MLGLNWAMTTYMGLGYDHLRLGYDHLHQESVPPMLGLN